MTKAGPLKILIVDDHAALRRTVRQMLEAAHVKRPRVEVICSKPTPTPS
jgi:hypothetical protein